MIVLDLGEMSYREAWDRQIAVSQAVIDGAEDHLIFVEHRPVLTLGANFHNENLLLSVEEYEVRGIEVVPNDRGGDVTFHGPGQLVVYPIFDLNRQGRDLHKWMRTLEQAVIDTLATFGVVGKRFPPHTGVWVDNRKIAAIGIKVRKWVSIHGIAMNVSNNLAEFDLIVPCGIEGFDVTSLSREMGQPMSVYEVKPRVIEAFLKVH